jgi:predicted nucleic acid-binding protein
VTYLLDTNVISELRKYNNRQTHALDPHVRAWIDSVEPGSIWLSVISVFEIEIGILRMERRDTHQAKRLRLWLEKHVIPNFADRILPIDTAVALRSATLHIPDPRSDRDAFIAATALVHNMTVVTRNTAHFAATGVPLLNPWQP